MTVRYRTQTTTVYATSTIQSKTIPASVQIGDLMLAFVMHRDTLTPPSGWALVDSQVCTNTSLNQTLSIYKRVAVSGDAGSSTTWTQASSQRICVVIAAWYGDPGIDVITTAKLAQNNVTTNQIPVPGVTTTLDGQYLVIAGTNILANVSGNTSYILPDSVYARITIESVAENRLVVARRKERSGFTTSGNMTGNLTPGNTGTASISLIIDDGSGVFDSVPNVTQSTLLVLDTGDPDLRTTQSSLLVLGENVVTVPMRITQSVNLVLTEFITDLNVTQSAVLVLADHVPCLTKWAQCWIITRTDGVVYGFTTLDVPVLCRGVMCYPCDSLMATAAEHSTMLGTAGDMEATGIISDSGISAEDIQAGLFDRATIEVWNQPWDNVNDEIPFRIAAGTLGSVTFGLNQYTFQVRTDAAKLKQTALLETYTPGCRYQFGNQRDSRCPVDLTTITVSGAVDATVVANSSTMSTRRAFIDSTRAEAPGFFNFGRLTWLTGDNAGYSSEVKSSDGSTIVLWDTMPNIIQIGDTYDIHPGCDKTKNGHLLYNADMVDFGGFPDVPGQDSINQTPDQKG